MCDRMHVNLERTSTIAQGADRCTFRFHRWSGPNRVEADVLSAGPDS